VNTWRVILAALVIFGTGIVTGGLVVEQSARLRTPPSRPGPVAVRPAQSTSAGGMRLEFLRHIERDLNLTADQRERIGKLISESQERTRKLMEPVAPQLRQEMVHTKEAFRAVLTPQQAARFDELLKQQQHPREQHHPPPFRERLPQAPPQSNSPPPADL